MSDKYDKMAKKIMSQVEYCQEDRPGHEGHYHYHHIANALRMEAASDLARIKELEAMCKGRTVSCVCGGEKDREIAALRKRVCELESRCSIVIIEKEMKKREQAESQVAALRSQIEYEISSFEGLEKEMEEKVAGLTKERDHAIDLFQVAMRQLKNMPGWIAGESSAEYVKRLANWHESALAATQTAKEKP